MRSENLRTGEGVPCAKPTASNARGRGLFGLSLDWLVQLSLDPQSHGRLSRVVRVAVAQGESASLIPSELEAFYDVRRDTAVTLKELGNETSKDSGGHGGIP